MNTKLIMKLSIVVTILLIGFSPKSYSCTTFVLKNKTQIVYGISFDFDIGSGFVVNNQRGILKHAFVESETNLMTWTSKFGSITFNQIGMEFPHGGMNEKGLVIAQMYLSKTKYPEIDERKVISGLQWIQYQLDVSNSVEQVIASDTILRITNEIPIGMHVLVCDAKGKVASIEFLDGKMEYRLGNDFPIQLMNNNAYEESVSYLKQFDIMGGNKEVKWDNADDILAWSHNNTLAINQLFATAAKKMSSVDDNSNLVESGFEVLKSVTLGNHTKWSTVFDVTNRLIYFKNQERKEIITLDFEDFNFKNNTESIVLDIQSATSPNIMSQFVSYTTEINRKYTYDALLPLIESGFMPFEIPKEMTEAQIKLPETFTKKDL